MNINIGFAVIFSNDFHLRGQPKVAYTKICSKTTSFICISGSKFEYLTKFCMNVNIGYASEVKEMWYMYKYVQKHPLYKIYSSKHIEMSCVEIIT